MLDPNLPSNANKLPAEIEGIICECCTEFQGILCTYPNMPACRFNKELRSKLTEHRVVVLVEKVSDILDAYKVINLDGTPVKEG